MMKKAMQAACAGIYICAVIGLAYAEAPINKDEDNFAISGYDKVAYFTVGKAVMGKSEYEFDSRGCPMAVFQRLQP